MRSPYDIGYLDGRNHAVFLTARFVSEYSAKKHYSLDQLIKTLSDPASLQDALQNFDSGYFNNYDENIGTIE